MSQRILKNFESRGKISIAISEKRETCQLQCVLLALEGFYPLSILINKLSAMAAFHLHLSVQFYQKAPNHQSSII